MKNLLILIFSLLIFGCTKTEYKSNLKFDYFNFSERQFVLNNNIEEILKFKTILDFRGNPKWKILENRKVFDKNGNLLFLIIPEYIERDLNESTKPDFLIGLAWMNYTAHNYQSNIPSGRIDTIFYYYDENNNLIKKEQNNRISEFIYDNFNNVIERRFYSDSGEIIIHFSNYSYENNDGKINYVKDSAPNSSADERFTIKRIKEYNAKSIRYFKYDNQDRLIDDGRMNRKFDKNGRVIELDGDYDKSFIEYDPNGNKSTVINTNRTITYDPKTSIRKDNPLDTISIIYYLYDLKNLPIQEKTVDEKGKIIELIKFEYKYFYTN